jgi:hypothetical protein
MGGGYNTYSSSVAAVGNPALAGAASLAAGSGVPILPGAPALMARVLETAFAAPPVWAFVPYSPATVAVTAQVYNGSGGGGGGSGLPPILAEAGEGGATTGTTDVSAYGLGASMCGCCNGGAYSPLPPAGFAAWGQWARFANAPMAEALGCPGKW